ncbi:diaminopimelate epimerase [Streptomyces sp. H39-S7]|uniref:diaminopimelate epimerase n=1 Tax=Streptomyces sp. H39-S7 TaxID=3004357 RepID=UPI0022AFD469|nr:diaminopimelate epimerase [Streptomyces sp. H39-S7]MCZ4124977.1 diaminopimelate epimerase [Streptomyces sp. H39-S7]
MLTTQPHPAGHPFVKGHGAENDFVILPDPDGRRDLSPEEVARLCDRRTGLGADGLLRVVRCTADPEATAMAGEAEWFMDYRNADGSKGAMCGNGIRLVARYLVASGLARPGRFTIATRAGSRTVYLQDADGPVTVGMGRPGLAGPAGIEVTVGRRHWPALHVDMGNPHAVVVVDDLAHAGKLRTAPVVKPAHAYPLGVTVEFVTVVGDRHFAMRVYERGVGETRSCGTGACAAVTAMRQREAHPRSAHYIVDTAGGRLYIAVLHDGTMELTGPALIVAQGAVRLFA